MSGSPWPLERGSWYSSSAMPSARATLLLLFAVVIASVGIAVAGCDSSGTVIATDASAADAGPDVVVTFDGPTPLQELPGCTSQVADGGACLVTICSAHAAADAGVVSLASAGALDLTGGAFGDAGVQIGADNLGSYLYNTTGPMFMPGDTLSVSGAGATVPAFPTQTLVAPGAITVTSPEPGDAGALDIQTSQNLTVMWTGGATGDRVVFTLGAFFKSGASTSTVCSWDSAMGQGTIPASALASLVGTAQAGGSTAVWYQQAQTSFTAGRWAVVMRAAIQGGSLATFQ